MDGEKLLQEGGRGGRTSKGTLDKGDKALRARSNIIYACVRLKVEGMTLARGSA